MRGGSVGSLCFLAFLLSSGTKGQNVMNSQDHKGSASDVQAVSSVDHSKDKTSVQDNNRSEDKSSVAAAVATVETGNQGNSARPNWSVPSLGTNAQGNAHASANAQASENTNAYNHGYGYGYPHSNAANPYGNANANAGSGSQYGYPGFRSGAVEDESDLILNNQADNQEARNEMRTNDASDKESRMGGGYSYYGAFSGAVSRVVPQNEIIQPDLMPGGSNLIQCTHENEIHTIWSPTLQCLVCVCVRDGWALRPKCVSCSTCVTKPAPQPVPTIPFPPPLPPLKPESQVSCSPLPTNTPFENPLNPCQTCLCQKVVNVFGQEDVQIKCEENPSCVTPPGFIPIPPLQVPPKPIPMPLCESLPANVQFPHPTESCMICRCVVEMTSYLIPERRMICQPDLECGPGHEVIVPPPPPPVTEFPIIPYPTPPVTTITPPTDIEPVPWPPIVQPMPRPQSPLPGPPPHETCKPYPPDTPFQHPWDECQICVCSEIYGNNVVNIEVNCYTKKSCCVEPPIPEPVPAIPYKPVPSPGIIPNLIFIEPKCQYRAPNEPYVVDCNICVCETVYQYVYAKCTPQPNCGLLPGSSVDASAAAFAQTTGAGSSSADAYSHAMSGGFYNQGQASSSAVANVINGNQYPFIGGSPYSGYSSADASANTQTNYINQSPYSNYHPYSTGQSSALAQAEANSQTENLNLSPLYSQSYPYSIGQSSAQAQAEAMANAQSGNLNLSPYSNSYPFSPSGQSSAQSQAEASAVAESSLMYPYSSGGQSNALTQSEALAQLANYGQGGQSSAQAQSEAFAQAGLSLYGSPYGGLYPGQSQSNAQSEANALANAQMLGSLGTSPYGNNPFYPGGQSSAQAQAEAWANAQSQTLGSPYESYPGGNQADAQAQAGATSGSQLYPSLYPYPTNNIGSLYQPGVNGWDSSGQSQASAQAQAQADASSQALLYGTSSNAQSQASSQGSATAQSLAQAAATSGRPLIRSGKGLCKYSGDQYHHNCQACYCLAEPSGKIYTLCLGNPCA